MTQPGESAIEIGDAELREIRWRAFLAGYDQRNRDGLPGAAVKPLWEEFERWCKHERTAHLDELKRLADDA